MALGTNTEKKKLHGDLYQPVAKAWSENRLVFGQIDYHNNHVYIAAMHLVHYVLVYLYIYI